MNTEKSIDVLNALIVINNDRIERYAAAADETEEMDLKVLFSQFTQTSLKCKAELLNEVYKLGGTPIEENETISHFFSVWVDDDATIAGDDRDEILNSCAYGEDFAANTYNEALRNDFEVINSEQKTMLKAQHVSIKADHEKVKDLRCRLSKQY
jgi:uncharacterized protein (TIGR02284 family)